MSFKDILRLKKESSGELKREYVRYLVVGDNALALKMYVELKKIHGKDCVGFLHDQNLKAKDFCSMGPSILRGEKNIAYFKESYPHISHYAIEEDAKFFKELKWRSFKSRSKHEKLLFCENYFVQERLDFNETELFPFLEDSEFFSELNRERLNLKLTGIAKRVPDDFIDSGEFSLYCGNGSLLECEHLYWGRTPIEFLNLYEKKNDLTDEFIEFCESTKSPAALYIELSFSEKVTDMKETLFIPLSLTHEWGHFIGEFRDVIDGRQRAEFVTFLDKNHTSEEMISKKIRIFKRSLEKIFPAIKNIESEDFMRLSETSPCSVVSDEIYEKVKGELQNLHFFNYNAPLSIDRDLDKLSFFSRGIASFDHLARNELG